MWCSSQSPSANNSLNFTLCHYNCTVKILKSLVHFFHFRVDLLPERYMPPSERRELRRISIYLGSPCKKN